MPKIKKRKKSAMKVLDPDKKVLSITEAADFNNVTRQAIYVAIKLNKLKASKDGARWTISIDDLRDYQRTKYCRSKSVYEGELLFDNIKGYYSVNQTARLLSVPAQKIYYATRSGLMKAHRKGAAWVIHQQDIDFYRTNYLELNVDRRAA